MAAIVIRRWALPSPTEMAGQPQKKMERVWTLRFENIHIGARAERKLLTNASWINEGVPVVDGFGVNAVR